MAFKKILLAGDAATELTGTAYRMLIIDSAGDVVELAHGALNQVLTSSGSGADPTWAAAQGGTPDAHKDSHDPEDGSDPLDTAIAVSVGTTLAIGSGHEFSRADHVHDLGADCVDSGTLVADDVIDSEHIAADAIQAEHIDETDTAITFSQLILTPKADGSGTTEGTLFYDSDDDHVYVYVA